MRTRKVSLLPVMLLAVLAGIAWMVLTNHSLTAHKDEAWSALRVLEYFQRGGGRDCAKLEVAACTIQDRDTGFTIRAYCETESGSSFMGIWVWRNEGIYVTGYAVSFARWQSVCRRDGCLEADITLLQRVLK